MNRWQVLLCRCVMQLDRIPRYGRLYRLRTETRTVDKKPHWEWQRRGRWGMNLLDRMGLLWKYIDHTNPGWADDEDESLSG